MRVRSFLLLLSFLIGAAYLACATGSGRLTDAIEGDHRSAESKARDVYRHPRETLAFFGIEPDMTVLEIYPGGGWYSEILGPYLKDEGRLITALYDGNPATQEDWMSDYNARYVANFVDKPEVYGSIQVVDMAFPTPQPIAPPATVDLILDSRNAHNWIQWGGDATVEYFFRALKSGGTLGVIDHRLDDDMPYDAENGYVHENQLVKLIEKHGFELVSSSPLNRNPKDTKDHPEGVWTLPPSLALGADQSGKYLEIGESDRMTLKFVKP